VIAAAIVGYVLWRRRRARLGAWRAQLATSADDARTTRDLLATSSAPGAIDDARLQAMRHETDTVGAVLANLAATAPDDASRTRTKAVEDALRSYMLAIESEQMLHLQAATEDALADANVARRARATDLDVALSALQELMPPAEH